MKDADRWLPTKFRLTSSGWRGSRDPRYVAAASWFMTDLLAPCYAEALCRHAGGALLDLGCGRVPLYAMYRDKVESVTCVDWPNSLHESVHVDIGADLNLNLPLRDEIFDTVVCTDVLEHIAEPGRLMAEIFRVLRPKGKLILAVPFLYWIHEEPHDFFRYTEFGLSRLTARSGLDIVSLHRYGGALDVLVDLTAKVLALVVSRRVRSLVLGVYYGLARTLLRIVGRTRVLERASFLLPSGYVLVAKRP